MNPKLFEADVRASIERSHQAADVFRALDDGASLETTVLALDEILRPLNATQGKTQLFAKVHPDASLRETARTLEQELAAWMTELSLDRSLYERVASFESCANDGSAEGRVIEVTLRAFRRSGVDRDEATRTKIKALKDEIVRIGQDFDKNIIDGTAEFVIENGHRGLAGMPADFIASHPEREDGTVVITTDPQDRMPFMTFCESPDLRRDYHRLVMQRAYPENLEVLQKLLAKRHELARLLGFDNWADYITEDKMIGDGASAREFLERVVSLCRERADRDYRELLAEKRRDEPEAEIVYDYERGYLGEKIRKRDYDFDSQAVRPYFPYARVRDGILATSAELYGVEFRKVDDADVWHPSVECYDVIDGGQLVARFYLDMHAREGKFKHGAMFDVQN
ncbi:MAG: peptidase M3, partial [Planctomycetes bacterium]|nr:peptidase M3 [Planctomycetota bacterium]